MICAYYNSSVRNRIKVKVVDLKIKHYLGSNQISLAQGNKYRNNKKLCLNVSRSWMIPVKNLAGKQCFRAYLLTILNTLANAFFVHTSMSSVLR